MNITIGTAPDSWGVWFASDPKQISWQRYLDEIVEVGYRWTELGPYGYMPMNPAKLKAELEKRRLKICAGTVIGNLESPEAWPQLHQDALAVGELLAALESSLVVLIDDSYADPFTGKVLAPARLNGDSWKRLIESTHNLARSLHDRFGSKLLLHPHAETHIEFEDQIEQFLADTDPGLVGLCLDTGHHAYRGGDPVSFMRRHHSRIPYLHLKSVDPLKQKEAEKTNKPFGAAVADDVFCEPAKGAVDFPAFVKVLREIGYGGYGVVEQDMYPAPFDKPLPIAKRTRAYLTKLGMA